MYLEQFFNKGPYQGAASFNDDTLYNLHEHIDRLIQFYVFSSGKCSTL